MSHANIAWKDVAPSTFFTNLRDWARNVIAPDRESHVAESTQGDPYNVWIDRGATLMLDFRRNGTVTRTLRVTNTRIRLMRGLRKDTSLSVMHVSSMVTKDVVIEHSIRQSQAMVKGHTMPDLPDPVIPIGGDYLHLHKPYSVAADYGMHRENTPPPQVRDISDKLSIRKEEGQPSPRPMRVFKGSLLGYGIARVRPDDRDSNCFYLDIQDGKRGETRCWGKELESALSESGASKGELIKVEKWGKVACIVPKKIRKPDGSFEEIEVQAHRNKWAVERLR